MTEKYNMKNDVTLFLPGCPRVFPHKLYFHSGVYIVRLPYVWEDDYEMICPNPIFDVCRMVGDTVGMRTFNFHPVYINSNREVLEFFTDLIQRLTEFDVYTISECGDHFRDITYQDNNIDRKLKT